MKKQLLSLAVASAISYPSFAALPYGSYGATATMGQTASPVTINSTRSNPAAAYLVIDHKGKEKARVGYWSQFGGTVEFGQADNFQEDIDRLQDKLDELDASPSASLASEVKSEFNSLLLNFGENGTLKFSGTVAVPGLPVAFTVPQLEGVVLLDASYTTLGGVSFLDDPLVDVSGTLRTNSAVYIKGASVFQLGAGFSRPVFKNPGRGPLSGELILGAKANFFLTTLTKQVANIDRDDGKNVGDLISDGLSDNTKETTGFGLDLGAVWRSDFYQIGIAGKNLNAPSFDYGSLADNTAARYFSGELDMTETHTLDPQFTADGALYTRTKTFMVAGSLDLNEVNDAIGNKVQYLHLSGTYFPKHPAAPVARFGYQKNLTGEELSALNFGLGLFRGIANLDFTYGLETVEVDGSEMPRQVGFQLSFEESF